MTGDCSNGLGGKPPRGTTIQQQEALASAALPCPRKQVPHAIDSPRPPQKGKRVMWEKQQPENNDIRAEEEGPVCEDPTGRKGMLLKHGGARKNVHVVVKGKLQWLFEQDRLYWEVPTKDNVKGSSSSPHATASSDDASPATESELIMNANLLNGISPDGAPWCPVDHLSDSVNVGEDYQEDGDLQVGCSSTDDDYDTNDGSSDDDDSRNFDLEMSHLEMNAPEIEVFITTPQAPGVSVMAESSDGVSGFASMDEEGSSCFETRGEAINKEQEWKRQAAILKAKCKVLKMEKALVQQRWKEGCKQMMQAVEMAHSLRAAVESILKPLQNTVTASSQPCSSTPCRTVDKENESAEGLVERLQRLQACSDDRSCQQQLDSEIQLHLKQQQQQAKASLPEKDNKLQCKSRLQNKEPSNFHNTKEKCEKQRSQRARSRMKSASTSSMSLKTIKKENKVKALDENPLNSMSAKAQKSKTAIDRLLKQTEAGYNILEEDQAKEVQTKETVRKILAQIQVEAEQWTQVQDVLKHVCTEMTTLQQACQGWEKRALNAESQSVACQLERDEWQVKAQTAQQRMKELEVQLVQIQETVQKLKLCHAQEEQNQWSDVGSSSVDPSNILGYTLALEPISNTNSSDSGGHKILKEFEGCRNCGKLRHIMVEERQNLDRFGLLCDRHSIGRLVPRIPSPCRQHSSAHGSVPRFPSSCRQHPSAHGSLPRYPSPCVQHPLTISVPRVQSPRRSAIQETSQLRKIPRCMNHNTQHQQLTTPVTADNARTIAQQSSSNWKLGVKNDIMRSSSQEESQQTQTRWQKGPAQGHSKKSENQENTKGNASKSFAGMQRKGGAVQGRSLMRKVHQFPVGSNSRQPYHSASSIQDALPQDPLKEVSANVIPCRN